jgi:M6 family metalloprotease-like protein
VEKKNTRRKSMILRKWFILIIIFMIIGALSISKSVFAEVLPSTGDIKLPVILINFNDTNTEYTTADFESLLFEDTLGVATGPGTLKDYFDEVSYGAFSISPGTVAVSQWYTASLGHDDYDADPEGLVREALTLADGDIDFSEYDSDGNGEVDIVIVIHQGRGEEESGDTSDIWSHMDYLSMSADGKNISRYIIVPELSGSDSMLTIGRLAYEIGHTLGIPNLSDTDNTSSGIGAWGLMGTGWKNKTAITGDTPAHPTAWTKSYLGWITPTKLKGFVENEEIKAVSEEPDVYQLLNNPNGVDWEWDADSIPGTGEYFLLENRHQTGFDAGLPGSGLLIWHIYEAVDGTNVVNTYEGGKKLVDLEEADGLAELDAGPDYPGDDGDPFPGSSGNRTFTNTSNPNNFLYEDINKNIRRTGCGVFNISDPGISMTADFGCRFAVTHPGWDDIGAVLDKMGYDYFELYGEYERLKKIEFLEVFDALFINCAGDIDTSFTETIKNTVGSWVEDGNGLYASDWGYTYVNKIFPDKIIFPDSPKIGNVQEVTARVTDGGLRNYLGSNKLDIYYDLGAWVVIDSVAADTKVLLTSDVDVTAGAPPLTPTLQRPTSPTKSSAKSMLDDSILAATFQSGNGSVVYTTFHNEANISEDIQKFLEYSVLIPITSQQRQEVIDLLESLGYDVDDPTLNSINKGEEKFFTTYEITTETKLAFILSWQSGTMKLSVFKPDGSLYAEKESGESPIIIEVNNPDQGQWTYKVTAIDVAYDNYPFVVGTGSQGGPPEHFLTVTKNGTGTGIVISEDGNIDCGNDCEYKFKEGTTVVLTAQADDDSGLFQWAGDCDTVEGTTCTVMVDSEKTVNATFNELFTLTVKTSGDGIGTITSGDGIIDCGNMCEGDFPENTVVTLTAEEADDSALTSWEGCEATDGVTCAVTVDSNKTVKVKFDKVVPIRIKKGLIVKKKNKENKDSLKLLLKDCTGLKKALSKIENSSVEFSIINLDTQDVIVSKKIQGGFIDPNDAKTTYKYIGKENKPEKQIHKFKPEQEKISCKIKKSNFGELTPDTDTTQVQLKIRIKVDTTTFQSLQNWQVKDKANKTKLMYR